MIIEGEADEPGEEGDLLGQISRETCKEFSRCAGYPSIVVNGTGIEVEILYPSPFQAFYELPLIFL